MKEKDCKIDELTQEMEKRQKEFDEKEKSYKSYMDLFNKQKTQMQKMKKEITDLRTKNGELENFIKQQETEVR